MKFANIVFFSIMKKKFYLLILWIMDAFNAQFSDPFNSNPQQPTPQPVPQQIPQQAPQIQEPNFWGNEINNQVMIGENQNMISQQNFQQSLQPVETTFQPKFEESNLSTSIEASRETNKKEEAWLSSTEEKKSNGWGVVSLILAILWIVWVLFVVTAPLGIVFLILAFLFWLIGLFKKPRGKAITGFIISGLSLGTMAAAVYYLVWILWDPIMNAVQRYNDEIKPRFETIFLENVDKINEDEFWNYLSDFIEKDLTARFSGQEIEIEWIEDMKNIKSKEEIKTLLNFFFNTIIDSSIDAMDKFAESKEISLDYVEKSDSEDISNEEEENEDLLEDLLEDELIDEDWDDEYGLEEDEWFDEEWNLEDEEMGKEWEINEEFLEEDEEHGTDKEGEEEFWNEEVFEWENETEEIEDNE